MENQKRCNNPNCKRCSNKICPEPIKNIPNEEFNNREFNGESDFPIAETYEMKNIPQHHGNNNNFAPECTTEEQYQNSHCNPNNYNNDNNNADDLFEQIESGTNCSTTIENNQYNNYCNNPHCNNPKCNRFKISDEYLLDYLLKKYKLDKYKLISSILKTREHEFKQNIIKNFYKQNKNIKHKSFKEQYKFFKKWNNSGIDFNKEELEDYYEENIKPSD